MPRVHLTEADRKNARIEKTAKSFRDGLFLYKKEKHLNNEDFGKVLNVSQPTMAKLLNGKHVTLSVNAFFAALELAGLEVRKIEK